MADKNPKHPLKKKQAKAKDKKKHIYEQVNAKGKNPVGSLMRTGRVLFYKFLVFYKNISLLSVKDGKIENV